MFYLPFFVLYSTLKFELHSKWKLDVCKNDENKRSIKLNRKSKLNKLFLKLILSEHIVK